MSLLTQVNKKVSDSEKEQIQEIVSRLTKPVHFKLKKSDEDAGPSRMKRPKEDGSSLKDFQGKASIN